MNESKDLLLKYLCMALPYGVKCKYTSIQNGLEIRNGIGELTAIDKDVRGLKHTYVKIDGHLIGLSDFKPYLRPMSSMTEEECKELAKLDESTFDWYTIPNRPYYFEIATYKQIDWLLEHHFDFMGLIPKVLAIEVTKDDNPYKD